MASLLRRLDIFYGWWIVFSAASIVFLTAGVFFYGFGLLVTPFTEEFGWSRAAISLGFSLRGEVASVAAPIVGIAVDRLGVRKLTAAGVVIAAIGFVLLSRVESLTSFYIAIFVIALGMSSTGGANAATIIARWFRRKRGKAMGLATLGGGMGGISAVVFAWLISEMGWRDALVAVGIMQIVVSLPLALTIADKPEDLGLNVDGDSDAQAIAAGAAAKVETATGREYTGKEALRSSLFWRVALTYALASFASTTIIVHQIPFLVEQIGSSTAFAAVSMTVMTAISLAGRLAFGVAADRYSHAMLGAVAMACTAVGLLLYATVHHEWQLIYVLPIFGVGFGAVIPLRAVMQAEYFGVKSFGTIQGMIFTASTIGSILGPLIAGYLYDQTADYRLSFVLLSIGPFLGIPLVLSTRGAAARARAAIVGAQGASGA